MKKGTKKFRLVHTPRYLKGAVPKDVLRVDLLEFNKHRYEIFTMKSKIDDKPLPFMPKSDRRKMFADALRQEEIDRVNKALLRKINVINRTIGKIDSYNPLAYKRKSSWRDHLSNMKRIESDNKKVYQLITNVHSHYSREEMLECFKKFKGALQKNCRFPLILLDKHPTDELLHKEPSISGMLEQTKFRPFCFLEFSVKDGPKLGRVEIELYEDHVPVTVQNFLALCQGTYKITYKNCLIHRIIPGKFCETGDIVKQTGRSGKSIYGNFFAEEGHKLMHTRTGVLSMVRVGNQENHSQFCITFSKMESLDKRNVVFGKIVKGIDNLLKIQGYGRKIGKPLAPVIISDCGEICKENEEEANKF